MTQENATGYTTVPQGPGMGEATAGADYKKDIVAIDIRSNSKDTGPAGRQGRDETLIDVREGNKYGSKGL